MCVRETGPCVVDDDSERPVSVEKKRQKWPRGDCEPAHLYLACIKKVGDEPGIGVHRKGSL